MEHSLHFLHDKPVITRISTEGKRTDRQTSALPLYGFTLIEVIGTILIASIAASVAGMFLVRMVEGFGLSKENMKLFQKSQLAMSRITQEFQNIISVSSGTNSSITYTAKHGAGAGGEETHTITFSGGNAITIDGYTITDQVSQLTLTYYDSFNSTGAGIRNTWISGASTMINISLSLSGAGGTIVTFNTRVLPRNI